MIEVGIMSDIHSHIQMPKGVLKQFVNEKQTLYYYDFASSQVKKGHPASLNTELNYYSKQTEDYLNKNIETPISNVIKFVKDNIISLDAFALPNKYYEIIKNYFYALLSRGENMIANTNDSSVYFQFFSLQDKHDITVTYGIELAKEKNILGDYFITFMVNKSKVPFILPMVGVYGFSFNGETVINMPITPTCTITFIHNSVKQQYVKEGIVKCFVIEDDTIANKLNLFAFHGESENNRRGVVANNRKMLEDVMQNYSKFLK